VASDTGGLPDQARGVPARPRLVVVTDRRRIRMPRRSSGEPRHLVPPAVICVADAIVHIRGEELRID
jgi:hypothetical protein